MMQMCRPRKPRKDEDPNGTYWFDDLDRRSRLYAYCKQDVVTERAVYGRIGGLSDTEQAVWTLDAAINARGMHLDVGLITAAIEIGKAAAAAIDVELAQITAGEITSIAQVEKLSEWLKTNGAEVADLGKETLRKALTRKEMSAAARRVIELRLSGAHAAAAKYKRMLAWRGSDNRARGAFIYHGAATGRWTSYGVQVQNLKKTGGIDIVAAIEDIQSATSNGCAANMMTRWRSLATLRARLYVPLLDIV
jgi:DNA polymerase bacteriophage-type